MAGRQTKLVIVSILAAGLCGSLHPLAAQDAPTADPFAEAGSGSAPTSSFQPTFGNTPLPDVNSTPGNAPAAPASTAGGPVEASSFQNTTPLAASTSPFAEPASAVGPAMTTAPAAIVTGNVDEMAAGATSPVNTTIAPGTAVSQGIIPAAPADTEVAANAPLSSPFGGPPTAGGPGAATGNTANGGKGISQLYEFRYVPTASFNGRKIVTRRQMTRDEAAAFDTAVSAEFAKMAEEGKLSNQNFNKASGRSQDWGQFMLYAFQLENWAIYCRDVALGGSGLEFNPATDIHWPGDPKVDKTGQNGQPNSDLASGTGKEGGGRPPAPKNLYNENRSLDDQVTGFFAVPDTRTGNQNGATNQVVDPKQMDDQAKKIYNTFLTQLRETEKKQMTFLRKLGGDIDERARNREAYTEWRDNQKRTVLDYVNDWNRRYEGQVVTVAGVRYELYRPGTVPANTTRFANIVVTDYELTPYDLLNEDGTLRGPAK